MRGGQQSPALGELAAHRAPVIRRTGQAVWGLVSAHQCFHGLISALGRLDAISVTLIKEIIHGNAAWLRHHFRRPGARGHAANAQYTICTGIYRRRHLPSRHGPEYMYAVRKVVHHGLGASACGLDAGIVAGSGAAAPAGSAFVAVSSAASAASTASAACSPPSATAASPSSR